MSVEQEQHWITGEEFARENRRLIEAGVPDEAAEFQALFTRVRERDDALFERYGKPLLQSHYGKWAAISPAGGVIIRDTAGEAVWAGAETFGEGEFALRRLADFPGFEAPLR
jgi:hypothetical protein